MTSPLRQLGQPGRPGTREALLDAVDALSAEQGWGSCSLKAVATRAGLTTGAVYSTFGSRGALLVEAMVRRTPTLATLSPDALDLATAVSSYAREYFTLATGEEGEALVLGQLELLQVSARDRNLMESMRHSYNHYIETLARDLESRAPDGLPASAREIAHRLLATLQGLTLQRCTFGPTVDEEMFVGAALNAVGLEPPELRSRTTRRAAPSRSPRGGP